MKINLDSEVMDLLMPDCRERDTPPQRVVKEILMEYYSTKKVNNYDSKNLQKTYEK